MKWTQNMNKTCSLQRCASLQTSCMLCSCLSVWDLETQWMCSRSKVDWDLITPRCFLDGFSAAFLFWRRRRRRNHSYCFSCLVFILVRCRLGSSLLSSVVVLFQAIKTKTRCQTDCVQKKEEAKKNWNSPSPDHHHKRLPSHFASKNLVPRLQLYFNSPIKILFMPTHDKDISIKQLLNLYIAVVFGQCVLLLTLGRWSVHYWLKVLYYNVDV